MTEYIKLKGNQKIIDEITWLDDFKYRGNSTKEIIERHSGVQEIDKEEYWGNAAKKRFLAKRHCTKRCATRRNSCPIFSFNKVAC